MKQNILHITAGIYANNGLESFLYDLVNGIKEHNHFIVTPPKKYSNIGLRIKSFQIHSLFEIKNIVEKHNIDIIHIHYTGSFCWDGNKDLIKHDDYYFLRDNNNLLDSYPFGYVCSANFWDLADENIKNRPKVIITAHSEMKLLPHIFCDTLVKVSNKIINTCINKKEVLIYNGVDTNLYIPKEKKQNEKLIVGWLGRLNKYNLAVYNAIKENEFINKECEFRYFGVGKLDKNPLPNHIFLGSIKHNRIPSFLNDIDIYLYPSIIDSFGISLIEAMSMGKACIVSDIVAEVIGKDQKAGYISIQPDDFVNDLIYLIQNPEIRQNLGIEARKRVLENFSLDKMLNSYKEIYQDG